MNASETVSFNEKHSLAIRIWHWCFFLLLTGSMLTVLFASTLFRTGDNIALVQEQLKQKQLTVKDDQARAVAHAFNDRLWQLHTLIGYFVALFLLGRFILEIFQPSDEQLREKVKKALGFHPSSPEEKGVKDHYLRVKWSYLIFYFFILLMALTGLGMAFEEVAIFKGIRGFLREVHSLVQYGIYGFVLLHLLGVIVADTGRYPGLVSGMIHGKKRV